MKRAAESQNGEDSTDEDSGKSECGVILSVHLENFRCHEVRAVQSIAQAGLRNLSLSKCWGPIHVGFTSCCSHQTSLLYCHLLRSFHCLEFTTIRKTHPGSIDSLQWMHSPWSHNSLSLWMFRRSWIWT